MLKRIALPFLFALTLAIPSIAHAQRKSPLADAPAIRKRVELRETRLEVGAGLLSTVNQTFYHGMMVGLRAGFHLTDSLSISAMGAFGVSSFSTGFHGRLEETLRDVTAGENRTPTLAVANSGINKASMVLAAQVEVTPFTGKYSMFGKLFAHYDFYLFGGGALVNLAAVNSPAAPVCADMAAANDVCVATGMKPGGTFGGGFHSFFNNFVALNAELRTVMIKDNPAGRDVNGDMDVNLGDLTWTPHVMASLGVTFYLPTIAPISN